MELVAKGIPAINKVGGLLLGAPHVRKVLAYLSLACDHQGARDDLEIVGEIANVASDEFRAPFTVRRHMPNCRSKPWQNCGCPIVREEGAGYCHTRYWSNAGVEKASRHYDGLWEGVLETQYEKNQGGYPTTASKAARDLVAFVNRLERKADNATVAIQTVVDRCVLPWLSAREGATEADLAEGKAEDFSVLLTLAEPEDTVAEFLERVDDLARGSSPEDEEGAVLIGTVHWSKGAERRQVIANVTRLPIAPPPRPANRLPVGGNTSLSEERRLLYVAVSRAKERAVIVGSREWQGKSMPTSQFVKEMGLV
jgi:superfamily I DNA/RNA helicase